ncbi:hypothetical protein [Clostridium sp.]|uniref:hypothetical protein n=1 Tax=Clostridium sp. TaxID=1506 RepID=UPI00283B903D|nr:hypothetical protein [Clostridium sp.]MDR3594782.1 hypothetical protein [Clostridium sp.]
MKEKFNSIYPIVNSILLISTLIFKSIDYILWLLILVLNIISLSISLKEDTKAKVGIKIFGGITLVLSICCVLYKLYEIIL